MLRLMPNEAGYPDDEPIETLHVYVEAEKKPLPPGARDSQLALLALAGLLTCIVALCLIPATPVYTISTITVPAHLSPVELRATVVITPTGIHTYPAKQASGVLTIYNGSFLTEQLPAHFLLTSSSGVEVQTDQAATIPAGNPPQSYGTATVQAHALGAGVGGDIPAYAIQQTYGTALFIKNLSAFTGGQDSYSVAYVAKQDISTALDTARAQLSVKQPIGLTTSPCVEKASQKALTLIVSWLCSYVTYTVPKGVQIVSLRVVGAMVVLQVKKPVEKQRTSFVVR